MTLFELIEHILDLGSSEPNVKFISQGDIYELNKRQDIDYPAFVVTQGVNYGSTEEGTETYGLTLFLVDRLTSDKSNEIDIQSWADSGLKNIISKIEYHNIGLIQGQYTVQTFTERFDSLCAGAFVQLNIKVDVLDCGLDSDNIRIVTSVNGQTGDVIVKGLEGAVVYSVNGQVGDVVLDIPDVTHFVTDSSVSDNYAKKSSLNNYLLKEDYTAPDVTKSYVDVKISDLNSSVSANYAKKTSLNDYLPKSEYVKPDVTKAYVDSKISDSSKYVSDKYATKTSLNNYLPKSEYVKPDVTKQYVDNKISDLSNTYATKTSLNRYLLIADYTAPDVTKRYVDVQDQKLATDIQDLSTLTNRRINNISDSIDSKILDISKGLNYKIIDISNNIDSKFTNLNIDIYNKFDILSDDIADQILEIDSKVENVQTDLNNKISDLDNKVDNVDSKIDDLSDNVSRETISLENKILDLSNNILDVSSNVDDLSTNVNDISTNVNDISNNISDLSTNVNDISTRVNDISTRVNDISNNISDLSTNINSSLAEFNNKIVNISTNIIQNISTLDSSIVNNYVNKTDFNNKLTDYYTKTEVNTKLNDYCLKSDVPSVDNFITNSSVEANYAKKTDIPTDFYSKSDIDNKLTNINSSISKLDSSVNYIETYYITKEHADSIYTPYLTFAYTIGGMNSKMESIEAEYNRQELIISNINKDVYDISVNKIPGLQTNIDSKQEKLISGTTIKTINGESILGNGDIKVSVGDLTNYYTKTEVNTKLNDYVLKEDIPDVTRLDSSVKLLTSGFIEITNYSIDVSTRVSDLSTYTYKLPTKQNMLDVSAIANSAYTKAEDAENYTYLHIKTINTSVNTLDSSMNKVYEFLSGPNIMYTEYFVYDSETKTLSITTL